MPATTAVTSAGVPETSRSSAIGGVLAVWLLSLAAILAIVVVVQGFQGSVSGAAKVAAAGRDLRPNNANARVVGAAIEVRNAKDAPLTVLQLPVRQFQALDLGHLRVDASPLPPDVEVALLWVRRTEPSNVHDQPLPLLRGRVVSPILLDRNPDWRGEIAMVALGVKGVSDEAWTIRSVTLDAAGARAIARDVYDQWTDFARWDGKSINVVFGGRESQRAYLPLAAFAASLATLAILRWRGRRLGRQLSAGLLVAPFAAAWILLDLRWQVELATKAHATWSEFAGLSLEERHLRMEDGDLYRTIAEAKRWLPGTPERVFVGSDLEYFLLRAAYHFYPHNVLAVGWYDGKAMRSGDLVFLYQKSNVRFEPAAQVLVWADGSRTSVVPVHVTTGAGLFRVH